MIQSLQLSNARSASPAAPNEGTAALLSELLETQQDLTAMERFSAWHDAAQDPPQRARALYESLIPLSHPSPGQQLAFQVDLEACSGCKACVTACHQANGLDEYETFREVGLLLGQSSLPMLQHVTTACHHCIEPGCLTGCPTQAYEKSATTGIVRHLDDQCFGCQYCLWTCPYEVPKYNARLGIVRKCDMCSQRLAEGEAPACVQSCPSRAIRIVVVNTSEVGGEGRLVSGAPDNAITRPTTQFVGNRGLDLSLLPADDSVDPPGHAHWPLIGLLLNVHASIGLTLVSVVLTLLTTMWGPTAQGAEPILGSDFSVALAATLFAGLGLLIAPLHLGRPLLAHRGWLGWRTSWLSREALAFGGHFATCALFTLLTAMFSAGMPSMVHWVRGMVACMALFCSIMVYVGTRRPCWQAEYVFPFFTASTLILGAAVLLALLALTGKIPSAVEVNGQGLTGVNQSLLKAGELQPAQIVSGLAIVGVGCLLLRALVASVWLNGWPWSPALTDVSAAHPAVIGSSPSMPDRIRKLLKTHLSGLVLARARTAQLLVLLLAGAWFALAGAHVPLGLQNLVGLMLLLVVLFSEGLERYLFFKTAIMRGMPGASPREGAHS